MPWATVVSLGTTPESITVDPLGRYVYMTNRGSNDVSQYTIGANGALTLMTERTVATGIDPWGITVDPSGRYAYVTNAGSNSVSQYTIGANGALTPMTPATVMAGTVLRSVKVDPSGKYAYVIGSNQILQYTIGADGTLTRNSPATIVRPGSAWSLAISQGSAPAKAIAKYAYVANQQDNTVSQYTIGADGALTPMTPATVEGGLLPFSITADPTGKNVYSLDLNNLYVYEIGPSGSLIYRNRIENIGSSPYMIAFDPTAKYAYVVIYGDIGHAYGVLELSVGTYGNLTVLGTASSGENPTSIAVHPSGSYAFVTNSMVNYTRGALSLYKIGTNGRLAHMQPPDIWGGVVPYAIAVDPAGRYAYAVNWGDNNVSQYGIGEGLLEPMQWPTVATGAGPQSIAVDPAGKYAYVTNTAGNNVSQYAIGADGALSPMTPATVAAGSEPMSVTVDPAGKYAYVTNRGSNTVSQYAIGANGALTPLAQATVGAGKGPRSITVVGSYQ